jgi:diguanylate cyclase (GGDEF)-like protein
LALLYLDLDGFKAVNDNLGHDAGDVALIEAALRVQYLLRNGETFARIGGDEFVVLMPVIDTLDEPLQLMKRIEEAFSDPFYIQAGDGVLLGASIGYAVFPNDGLTRLDLIACADNRMYDEKRRRALARL